MTRKIAALFFAIFSITAVVISVVPGGKVLAAAAVPTCDNTYLETWDWPADIKRGTKTGATTGAGITNFDKANQSWIIYRETSTTTSSPKRNLYKMVLSQTKTVWLGADSNGKPAIMNDGSVFYEGVLITSEPRNMVPPDYYKWPSGYADVDTGSITDGFYTRSLDPANVAAPVYCVVAAHNVGYMDNWTWDKFKSDQAYKAGADAAVTCTALDVACKISQAWNGVVDTFVSVGQAIVQGISSLFMPDSDQTKAQFDSLNSFMSAKLGFLVYPFDFMGDLFDAFGSGTSWCTSSSCTKSFGNLFGQPFNLNVNQMAVTMPTLWTWFVAMIRGLTILAVILAIRKKYLGIVHK